MIVLEWYGESGSLLSPLHLKFYYLNFINYFKIYIISFNRFYILGKLFDDKFYGFHFLYFI